MAIETKFIWMNGEFLPAEKATIPFLNNSLHYGMGFFEGLRSYETPKGAAVFRLKDHVNRLFDSLKIGGFNKIPYTREEICEAIKETIRMNDLTDSYIRPLFYFQDQVMALDITHGELKAGIAAWHWPSIYSQDKIEQGLKAGISSFARMNHNSFMAKAKATGNYTNSLYANHQAHLQGYDESILLDTEGFVSECSGENIFMVYKGRIWTPSLATVLDGITRDSVITLAKDKEYEIVEAQIARDMLYIADEVFICGTAAEVTAISEVDNRPIGTGKMGPITAELHQAYSDAVRGKGIHSSEWCDLV